MEPKTQKLKVAQGTARLQVAGLLADRGWNMLEFSRRSGLSYPTVLALVKETYRGPVSLDTALAVAMAFGISLDELITPRLRPAGDVPVGIPAWTPGV